MEWFLNLFKSIVLKQRHLGSRWLEKERHGLNLTVLFQLHVLYRLYHLKARCAMRLPLRQARLPSRIMRLEMSGYMEVTAAVAAAAPIAIPAINVKGFIDSHPLL